MSQKTVMEIPANPLLGDLRKRKKKLRVAAYCREKAPRPIGLAAVLFSHGNAWTEPWAQAGREMDSTGPMSWKGSSTNRARPSTHRSSTTPSSGLRPSVELLRLSPITKIEPSGTTTWVAKLEGSSRMGSRIYGSSRTTPST